MVKAIKWLAWEMAGVTLVWTAIHAPFESSYWLLAAAYFGVKCVARAATTYVFICSRWLGARESGLED